MTALAPADVKRDRTSRRRTPAVNRVQPYLWFVPAFALVILVVGYPIAANFVSSFTEAAAGGTRFVGLQQYVQLLSSPDFYSSVLKTIVWIVGVTVLQFLGGAATAVAADHNSWFIRRVRPILILPWVLPGVVAANIWVFFYNEHGLINDALSWVGIQTEQAWLADPQTALVAVIIAAGWKGFAFYFLLLLAGLQSVPQETREAAQVDGAGRFSTLVHVVLPQMKAIIFMSLALGVIATSNYFDGIYLMTGGGPTSATEILPVWLYNVAFSQFNIAKASALSVILLLLVLIPAGIRLVVAGRKARA